VQVGFRSPQDDIPFSCILVAILISLYAKNVCKYFYAKQTEVNNAKKNETKSNCGKKEFPHRPYDHCKMINFSLFIYWFTRESREPNSCFIFIFSLYFNYSLKVFSYFLFPFYFGCFVVVVVVIIIFSVFLTPHPTPHTPQSAPRPHVFEHPHLVTYQLQQMKSVQTLTETNCKVGITAV